MRPVARRRPSWTVPKENLRLARQDLVRVAARAEPRMKVAANLLYEAGVVDLRLRDEVYAAVDRLVAEAHVRLHGREDVVERMRRFSDPERSCP